jgi:Na+/H+-dicarboxylate symporter/ABC-type amino acid transport substrate-binding protein
LSDSRKSALQDNQKEKKKGSLSRLILIAFLLGAGTGLFFGESAAVLQIIGRIYFQLLQMTILPYVMFSLIANLGGLSPAAAKAITARTGWLLGLSWVVVLLLVLAGSLALPKVESASFFSTSDVMPPDSVDLLGLFIPSNPFRALSNNFVPAVVLFSISLGVALMGIGGKEPVLDQLKVIAKALSRISSTVAKLTPIGVFGVTASAAGTLTLEDLGRIEAYLILLIGMAILLVFWIFPMVLSVLTELPYRAILGRMTDALVVAFTTDSVFIALPLISEAAASLLDKDSQNAREKTQSFDVVLPVIFSFPNAGRLLLLLFVVFAAWFSGNPLATLEFPQFALAGLFTMFGSSSAAILFLLDFLRIPTDLFQLNLVTSLVTGRIASACSVMHLFAVGLLSIAPLKGIHLKSRQLLRLLAGSSVMLFVFLAGTHAYLSSRLSGVYEKDKVIAGMKPILATAPAVVHREGIPGPRDGGAASSQLDAIRSSGVLRVGYHPDALPFSYFSSSGELIGLDVEMAHLLARELGLRLEFFPITLDTVASQLSQHQIDVAVASIPGNTELFAKMRLVEPHLEVRLALVVPDHRREEFESVAAIRRMKDVRVGVSAGTYFAEKFQEWFPNLVVVTLRSPREFFEKKGADVFLGSAEGGSAWTLLYPAYSVVVPTPSKVFQPLSYAVSRDNTELGEFLDHWVRLKKADGTVDRLRDHWILGKGAVAHQPRWSVMRNVLGWAR